MSNQRGVSKGHQKPEDLHTKIINMGKSLGFPLVALFATHNDPMSKPSPNMWNYFVKNLNKAVKPGKKWS